MNVRGGSSPKTRGGEPDMTNPMRELYPGRMIRRCIRTYIHDITLTLHAYIPQKHIVQPRGHRLADIGRVHETADRLQNGLKVVLFGFATDEEVHAWGRR